MTLPLHSYTKAGDACVTQEAVQTKIMSRSMSDNKQNDAAPGPPARASGGNGTQDSAEHGSEAPSSSNDSARGDATKHSITPPGRSDDGLSSGVPDLRNFLPKVNLPDPKSMIPKYDATDRLAATMREANRISTILEEHARLTKHLDLLQSSAMIKALDELDNNAAVRAVRQLNKLQLPAGSAVDEIVHGYRAHFERQLRPIQELLKSHHATDHLESLRDGFAKQFANSYLHSDTARQFARLDQHATASLAAAAAVKLRGPEFHAFTALRQSLDKNSDVASIIQSFQTPWAKLDDLLGSALGVAEASTLFAAVRHHNPFDDRITEYLRFEFGDYRDAGTWDEGHVQDPAVRLELYTEHGLREELRETPGEVLVEAETQVVIHRPAAIILTPFSFRALFISDGQEPYMMAHQALRILERRLRDVINAEMTRVYGRKWIKSTLKPEIRDDWIRKQEQAVRQGRPQDPLIEYADFTHYEQIITANAPWEAIFKAIFKRQEDVRESFQRLGPVRIATYHARSVLDMDILVLAAEGMRLMQALTAVAA